MDNKFKIIKCTVLASWSYNLELNNDCTICRCSLNSNSLYNQEKGIDSIIKKGLCGHVFHYECIKPWVDKNKYCPICSTTWHYY